MTNTAVLNKDPVLAEIVRRLIQDFHPKRIYLFGSRGREDSSQESDYDLLVIMGKMDAPGYRLAQRAHRSTFQGIAAPVDVVMMTEQQFEAKKAVIGTLPETAIHEGKELYAA